MNKKWRGRLFRYTPLVLWTAVVLGLSTSAGSLSSTSRFIRPVLEFLFPNAPETTLVYYHFLIRKVAHLSEYAILAFFAARAYIGSQWPFLSDRWHFAALLSAAAVAVVDELNQTLRPERTGSAGDIGIDLAGAIAMIGILVMLQKSRKN